MIRLHHLNNSRSQRILWLLEELELDYEIVTHQRDAKTSLAPESLTQVHSLGRSPVLETPHGVIAESGAIVEYLVRRHGHSKFCVPQDEAARVQYDFWMHFAEGSLMPPLVARLVLGKAKDKASPFFLKPLVASIVDAILGAYYGPNLTKSLAYVEQYLRDHGCFAGDDLSGADVMMLFPLESLVATGHAQKFPAITAYVQRLHQRPAYQRALKRGGEYAYAAAA